MENILAKNIKILREKSGLTQSELANQLNINPKSLGSYEQGIAEPKVSTLMLLANFFRISLEELITGHKPKFVDDSHIQTLNNSNHTGQDTTTKEDSSPCREQLEALEKENIGLKAQIELLKELLGKK